VKGSDGTIRQKYGKIKLTSRTEVLWVRINVSPVTFYLDDATKSYATGHHDQQYQTLWMWSTINAVKGPTAAAQ
jgi:hypothetical protein